MALNKEGFLKAAKKVFATEQVEVGEDVVIVSELDATDYIKIFTENSENGKVNMKTFTPALIAYSLVDEEGNRLFDNIEELTNARIPQSIFTKIGEVAKKLNGMTGEEKNASEPTQDGSTAGESQLLLDIDTPTT